MCDLNYDEMTKEELIQYIKECKEKRAFTYEDQMKCNRQISRRMDTHGIIVVERFATFHYY